MSTKLHILGDLWGCNAEALDSPSQVLIALRQAAKEAEATVLSAPYHKFDPIGVTAVALLAESHISIHTWPEDGYASVDVLMCNNAEPVRVVYTIGRILVAETIEVKVIERGTHALVDGS